MRLFVTLFLFFLSILLLVCGQSSQREKDFFQRGMIILNVIESYKKDKGYYPRDLSHCFLNLIPTSKEMYIFPFDKDERLAFDYEFDSFAGENILIVGDRYPPNLIIFTETGKFIFNSDLISRNGL